MTRFALCACVAFLAVSSALAAENPAFGPRMIVDARLWNTPGWQARDGDFGYATASRADEVRSALQNVPAGRRMVVASDLTVLGRLLEQLATTDFKLGAIGHELGAGADALAVAERGKAMARKFGVAYVVALPKNAAAATMERLASVADVLTIDSEAGQRSLLEKMRAANPGTALFHRSGDAGTLLRNYRMNSDMFNGLVVSETGTAGARRLRAIRPMVGAKTAVAPGEGPSMYFFTFHWKTAGWQPRKGDYACAKIRPTLKTFEEKVAYVLADLKDIPVENRMIQFNGLEGADELLREIIEARRFPIACLGYDLEEWALTPENERTDPVGAAKQGQRLADKYGMDFIVTPDFPMSNKWGPKIAPFIKAIKPQSKGLQARNIDEAIAHHRKLYVQIRRANPDVRILHDLGIRPKGNLMTPEKLFQYYAGLADLVDGIGIFSVNTPEQNAVVEKYIVGVRPPYQGNGGAAKK